MKKFDKCKILKTKNKQTIRLTEIDNYTYADFGNKICKLPYNLNKAIRFLQMIEII